MKMEARFEQSILKEGDVIFTSIPNFLYQAVEDATDSPTSHVGIIFKKNDEWVVAESRVPKSCYTPLSEFIERSKNGWVSVKRLSRDLNGNQIEKMKFEAEKRMDKFYHFGFKYDSKREFCSKFVHDVFKSSIGVKIGSVVTFKELLGENPSAKTSFWKLWFFGLIPWDRKTITPHSQLTDEKLTLVV